MMLKLLPLSLVLLVALAACRREAVPQSPDSIPADTQGYAGSEACAPCHAVEFQAHQGSRHAQTMRAARPSALGPLSPSPGSVPLAGYSLEAQADHLVLTRVIEPRGPVPLDLALGSGKVGLTFVSIQKPDTLLQAKASYFPEGRQWDTTPGQQEQHVGDSVFGRPEQGVEARRCVGCHSVTLPADSLRPDPRFYGVGCESCHGAGKAHITAMQASNRLPAAPIYMERLERLPSDKLNDLCGKCHRTLKDIDIQSPEGLQTHRFQPYALTRSRCRNKNGSVLSCMTCHTPHTDASTNLKQYEAICLSCHQAATASASPAAHTAKAANQGKVCPVNAVTNCVSCHMRARQSFPGLFWKPMVDHLISTPPNAHTVSHAQ